MPRPLDSDRPDHPAASGTSRRRFLVGGVAVAGAAVVPVVVGAASGADAEPQASTATAQSERVVTQAVGTASGWYGPHRAPLAPAAFQRLPPGAVTASGWIAGQLDLQRDGLNGRMAEISDYLVYDECGWVNSAKVGWEELPYWLRGYSDLGFVTGDEKIKAAALHWIDGILATQQADGWFGPQSLRTSLEGGPDFWPSMPILDLLRTHQEATGDARIVPFMTKFFGFMRTVPDAVFGRSWGAARWGDNIDTLQWLYDRTGDTWLLDLVTRIHRNSQNYVDNLPTPHNVNLAQGFREPAQYSLVASGTERAKMIKGTYDTYARMMRLYGQFAGGGIAGDENARPGFGDPRQGFETCGIVELMRSCEILHRITGDPVWAERCEDLAVNSLPAAFDPTQRALHYVTSANSVALENAGKHPQFDNGFAMQALRPGIHIYRCCPHNYGQGWPYLVEEMWVATSDSGLCASMYGPSQVRAKVGASGREVTITERTDYPFDETVTLTVDTAADVVFPLWLRIPAWADGATVTVNGRATARRPKAGAYFVVERTWRRGDAVALRLPMRTSVQQWQANGNSGTVRRGPLAYSLRIGEKYTTFTSDDQFVHAPGWPHLEVHATSAWNVALDIDPAQADSQIEVRRSTAGVAAQPFTLDAVPVTLQVPVRTVSNWDADARNVVRHLQPSPVNTSGGRTTATLVPMGAARLRITSFPIAARSAAGHEWERVSASYCFDGDLVDAVNDGLTPASSSDGMMPRLTFWDHLGTSEWVRYDYAGAVKVSSAQVYWYDDTGSGQCRVPKSWRLEYLRDGVWTPVTTPSGYGVAKDAWNTVTFTAVQTTALRLVIQLAAGVSGGVLEWRVPQG